MANALGFNYGDVVRNVENIKTSRQNREFNQFKMDAAKQEQERFNALGGIREQAIGGSVDAQKQLLALDPAGAPVFLDALSKMDDSQRAIAKGNIEEMGRISASILQAKTPQEREIMYQEARTMLPPEAVAKMPAQYNENYLKLSIAKASAMDKLLSNPEVVKYGDQDIMYQGGQEVSRTQRPQKELVPASGSSGPKTADYNLVMRAIVPALGGTIDDRGNIRGLRDSTELNAIAELGAQLLQSGDAPNPIAAGTEALRRYGKTVKTPTQSANPNDPAGIRNYFLSTP